jgi:hypothetical protein
MEAMDNEVRKVMLVEIETIINVPSRPTFPTTHPNLRYMITPKMVRMEGVNTPSNMLNPPDLTGDSAVPGCFNRKSS